MVLRQLKDKIMGSAHSSKENDSAYILILEDDPDQMEMLTNFALNELQNLIKNENISQEVEEKIAKIKVISVTHIDGLKKVSEKYSPVLLALLDGNTPDEKDGKPHDQFVKKNHLITGKHRAIEVVKKTLPDTPITMISTLDRFKKIVFKYYNTEHKLNINFINKNDQDKIGKNIAYYLRQYLNGG